MKSLPAASVFMRMNRRTMTADLRLGLWTVALELWLGTFTVNAIVVRVVLSSSLLAIPHIPYTGLAAISKRFRPDDL